MNIATISGSIITALFLLLPVNFSHADETVYGWQLMTEQERIQHRERMRSLQTEEEREAYRLEHHKLMQERARERGVTLPETPQPRGKGMGSQGGGPGQGMGMGRGGGRNP